MAVGNEFTNVFWEWHSNVPIVGFPFLSFHIPPPPLLFFSKIGVHPGHMQHQRLLFWLTLGAGVFVPTRLLRPVVPIKCVHSFIRSFRFFYSISVQAIAAGMRDATVMAGPSPCRNNHSVFAVPIGLEHIVRNGKDDWRANGGRRRRRMG